MVLFSLVATILFRAILTGKIYQKITGNLIGINIKIDMNQLSAICLMKGINASSALSLYPPSGMIKSAYIFVGSINE